MLGKLYIEFKTLEESMAKVCKLSEHLLPIIYIKFLCFQFIDLSGIYYNYAYSFFGLY